MSIRRTASWVLAAAFYLTRTGSAQQQPTSSDTVGASWEYDSQLFRYRVEVVAAGLTVPWGIAFLPDGRALITDRPGTLWLLDMRTHGMTRVAGVPAVSDTVDGGLLDIQLHPDYARNGWLYFSYAEKTDTGKATVVERTHLRDGTLADRQRLFAAYPAVAGDYHFGGRLALNGGYLYLTLGEREISALAQELWTDLGKVIRLHDDGRVPSDNPFVGRAGARPELWSYGHRNPHGLAFHPETGELWESEHGPLAGDEINVIKRGLNYGWPTVSFGREYDGGPVGDGLTQATGMEPPVHHYSTSAALSGIAFYTGASFPRWRNNLFVGAMTPRFLSRLVVDRGRVVSEERLLLEKRWRVRVVQTGPDGYLYLGVQRASDASGGVIARIRPVSK
jgi:glucose/arabinose dehydrogenase